MFQNHNLQEALLYELIPVQEYLQSRTGFQIDLYTAYGGMESPSSPFFLFGSSLHYAFDILKKRKPVDGEESLQLTAEALQEKVEKIPDEKQCEPEPYVAVPAIQQIAYCFDSEVLRDMYANLLAA